jgi:hypothetical protein
MARTRRRQAAIARSRASHGSFLQGDAADPTGVDQGKDSATQGVRVASRQREERLEEDEHEIRVPRGKRHFLVSLKNGRQMDIRNVQAVMTKFRLLRKAHPLHFQALLDIAQGNVGNVNNETINDLKEWRFLSQDASMLNPNERDVLLAAGPELQDPYKMDTVQGKFAVALAEEETEDHFRRRVKKLLKPDQGGKPNRSQE